MDKSGELTSGDSTLKALFYALAGIFLSILGLVVVPIALLFCNESSEHLPQWAWIWDDPTYGINGDPYWAKAEHANGHQREYLWRWRWLMRNRMGGWSSKVTGVPYMRIKSIQYTGDPYIMNVPFGHAGTLRVYAKLDDGREITEYYYIRQWGKSGRCIRLRVGHKLQEALHYYLRERELPTRTDSVPSVFSFNPLMTFRRHDA